VVYVCPYCSTLYRHDPALAPKQTRPVECEFHDIIIWFRHQSIGHCFATHRAKVTEASVSLTLKLSRFPFVHDLAGFDFAAQPSIDPEQDRKPTEVEANDPATKSGFAGVASGGRLTLNPSRLALAVAVDL
jgi:hypothetical protein